MGLRVADHVGFVLQGEVHHKITLLHVDKGQKIDNVTLFADAKKILVDYGVHEENILTKVIHSHRVVNTILKTIDKGSFAVLAVGLSGRTEKKGLEKLLAGEKCKRIFEGIDKSSLWIVP